jgi:hypothetical protein
MGFVLPDQSLREDSHAAVGFFIHGDARITSGVHFSVATTVFMVVQVYLFPVVPDPSSRRRRLGF